MLTELDGNSEIVKSTILGTSYNVELVGSTGDGVNVYRFNFVPLDITYPLIENTEIYFIMKIQQVKYIYQTHIQLH